jgi:simple sugar transport system ATP-binding protein
MEQVEDATASSRADADPPLLSVEHISKSYGHVQALTDVSFTVSAGEVVGLVGDNGAGKSTLIKVVSGVHPADSGTIRLAGVEQHFRSPRDAIDAGIETLYQDSSLALPLSIGANVFLGREQVRPGILGKLGFLAQRDMDRKAHAQLAEVGIAVPKARSMVSELSGGQRQAVAIGRAVAWARKVIVLDEPTNNLGARQSREVLEVIRSAKKAGLAVVFISHTLPFVLEVTDRLVVMRLGRVVRDAPTSEFNNETLLGTITGLIGENADSQ